MLDKAVFFLFSTQYRSINSGVRARKFENERNAVIGLYGRTLFDHFVTSFDKIGQFLTF